LLIIYIIALYSYDRSKAVFSVFRDSETSFLLFEQNRNNKTQAKYIAFHLGRRNVHRGTAALFFGISQKFINLYRISLSTKVTPRLDESDGLVPTVLV
jgi:hypothetical protein